MGEIVKIESEWQAAEDCAGEPVGEIHFSEAGFEADLYGKDGRVDIKNNQEISDLTRRAQNNDAEAWDTLAKTFTPLILSIVSKIGLNREDQQDVAQTLWVRLLTKGDLSNIRSLTAYLIIAARHEASRVGKANDRLALNNGSILDLWDGIVDPGLSPDEVIIADEEARAVKSALSQLPEKRRGLLELLFYEELEYSTITALTGIPRGSIGPMRMKGLNKLGKILAAEGFDSLQETA